MYHIKNDQRAIRSSQMIYDALASLMREKAFDTITVIDVVETAQVGRATFYRNFDAIEDILRMRCDQTFNELESYMKDYLQRHTTETGTRLLKPLLRYFYLNSEIIELLLIAQRIDIIQDSFRVSMEPFRMHIAALADVAEEYAEYAISIRIGIMTSILVHWIESGKRQAPDDLADTLSLMIDKMVTIDQIL